MTIMGGERQNSYDGAGGTLWNVPKQDLMAELNVLLERGYLKIAKGMVGPGSASKELKDIRAKLG